MPFGLTNAPLTFQRLVDNVFTPNKKDFILVYIDDIIIFSRTWNEHLNHIKQTLEVLKKANLKIKLKKCYFTHHFAKYLSFIISSNSIQTNPAKVSAVTHLAPPRNLNEVCAFLGMVSYYRHFLKDLAKVAEPLYEL